MRCPASCRAVGVCLLMAAILPGCASRGGQTYNDRDIRRVQTAQYGTIADVTEVQVEDDPTLFGPVVGGVAGGVLGSVFGSGAGKVLTTLGGAAGGALFGGLVESSARSYSATQLTIDLESGENIVIVQGNDEYFAKGDPVRVILLGNGKARVQHK